MYTSYQLAKKYIRYYLTASNGKGHGVHSPFVFDFIKNVLRDNKAYDCYEQIESLRKELSGDELIIEVEDFGAGSAMMPFKKRSVKSIAKSSLKTKKFSQLLYRIAKYYQPKTIVELGTSLGVTTAYLSCANENTSVYTFEGSGNIAAIAKENFNKLGLQNIKIIEGDFDKTLIPALSEISKIDMAFADGNHRKKPTLRYFEQLLKNCDEHSFIIFDDIHWSKEMEEAWQEIKDHDAVTLSIDLFFIGIIFLKKEFRVKQHFIIRF